MIYLNGNGIIANIVYRLLRQISDTIIWNKGIRPPLSDTRIYSLNYFSLQLLDYLGLRFKDSSITYYSKIHTWVSQSPHSLIKFDSHSIGLPYLGALISDRDMYSTVEIKAPIQSKLAEPSEELKKEELKEEELKEEELKDSSKALTIEATGKKISGIEYHTQVCNQSYVTAQLTIDHQSPHTIYQVLDKNQSMGILPYKKNQASLIWARPMIDSIGAAELKYAIQKYFGDIVKVKEVRDSVVIQNKQFYWAQSNPHSNAVIMGDSAYRIHPLAGQGLNQALASSLLLYDTMKFKSNPSDIAKTYGRMWHSQILPTLLLIQSFNSSLGFPRVLLSNALPLARLIPCLKKQAIKKALNLEQLKLLNKYRIKYC